MKTDETDRNRRLLVVGAVRAIVARDGLDGLTMRGVAEEAGFSLGMVQRLFTTKDEMLRAAMNSVVAELGERVAMLGKQPSARAALRRLAVLLLGVDGLDRDTALVWLAFAARAAVSPELAHELRGHYAPAQRSVRQVLTAAQRRGELAPGVRPEPEAVALLALIDGLTVQLAVGLVEDSRARALTTMRVDSLFA